MILEQFSEWMKEHTDLADSSIYKYSRAVNTISNDMRSLGVISGDLLNMSVMQLDVAVSLILYNPEFVCKNNTGNNMYSNALKQFRLFRNTEFVDTIDTNEAKNVIDRYDLLETTEKDELIKSRLGQGIFRKRLIEKYNSRCIITGINEKRLLIASHIKP